MARVLRRRSSGKRGEEVAAGKLASIKAVEKPVVLLNIDEVLGGVDLAAFESPP